MGTGKHQVTPFAAASDQPLKKERGKVGMAILLWLLGVPGSIILLYLIFAH